jgi:hypothetical protein
MSNIVLEGHWCDYDDDNDNDVRNSPAPNELHVNTKAGYYLNKYISCWLLPCHMRNFVEGFNVTCMRIYFQSHTFQRYSI